ncbi:MAG: hypothetical protein ACPLPS_02910 [bacterium]
MKKELSILFLHSLCEILFVGDLYIWVFLLKNHPWRRKVLVELLFLVPIIIAFWAWMELRRGQLASQENLRGLCSLFAFLLLCLLAAISFHLWISYSGAIFWLSFILYLKFLITKGAGLAKEELVKEINLQIAKSKEILRRKWGRILLYFSRVFVPVLFFAIILKLFYIIFFKIGLDICFIKDLRIRQDDRYAAFILIRGLSEHPFSFNILSIPEKRIVYELPYDYPSIHLHIIGWIEGNLVVELTQGGRKWLIVMREEGKSFRASFEEFPPYENLFVLGSHLYAKGRNDYLLRLRREKGKWKVEAAYPPLEKEINSVKKDERYVYKRYQHIFEMQGEPVYVLLEERREKGKVYYKDGTYLGEAFYRLGIQMPRGKLNWLSQFETLVNPLGEIVSFSASKDRCYLLIQVIDIKTGKPLPRFSLFEISNKVIRAQETVWHIEKFKGFYELCSTPRGYLLIYPRFILSFRDGRGKMYLFSLSPLGEKGVIKWRYDGVSNAKALNREDKVLLFAGKRGYLVDVKNLKIEEILRLSLVWNK